MAKRTLPLWALRAAVAATGLLAAGAAVSAGEALAHQSGCHASHTCPSDRHTYVWHDTSGRAWDCAKRSSDAYDETRDTTRIVYDDRIWLCRAAGAGATSGRERSWFSQVFVQVVVGVISAAVLALLAWTVRPFRARLELIIRLAVRRALRPPARRGRS